MNRKGYGRKLSWPNLRYHPVIFLDGLRKIEKNLRRVIRVWTASRSMQPQLALFEPSASDAVEMNL
jgi:hypothetical protein